MPTTYDSAVIVWGLTRQLAKIFPIWAGDIAGAQGDRGGIRVTSSAASRA